MNTVNDLRQALSDEVTRLQPPAGLETRVLQQALHSTGLVVPGHRTERRRAVRTWEPKRRTELAAGIAAVVLAAMVIGTFAYIRLNTRPHTFAPPITSASPSPSALRSCPPYMGFPPGEPCPTPLSQPLNVDPATPVILFSDPGNAQQIDGVTWDGQVSGKLTQIPGSVTNQAGASDPAGTLIAMFPDIFDRSGRVVATLVGDRAQYPNQFFDGTWADDELHYCQVVPVFAAGPNPEPGTLQLTTPGGTPHDVAQVGQTYPNAGGALSVAACSVLAGRAVVVQLGPNGSNPINQYWVVQLSNGRILWTHDLRGSKSIARVVASRDGQYVAEVQSTGTTTIYGQNGSAVGRVAGSVEGFSWDGSLTVVSTSTSGVGSSSAYGTRPRVIRWRDGTVIWAATPAQGLSGSQPEPGGASLAIETLDLAHPLAGDPTICGCVRYPIVVYVVSSDGHVHVLPKYTSLLGAT